MRAGPLRIITEYINRKPTSPVKSVTEEDPRAETSNNSRLLVIVYLNYITFYKVQPLIIIIYTSEVKLTVLACHSWLPKASICVWVMAPITLTLKMRLREGGAGVSF